MKGPRGVGGVPLPPTWSRDLRRGWFRWHAPLLCGEGGEALQEGRAHLQDGCLRAEGE